MTERVLILDFGSQYTQLIARRVREHRVYCEIHPCTVDDDVRPRLRAGRHHPLRRPRLDPRGRQPARPHGRVRPRRPGARRLLRRADHVRPARRPGRALDRARIWPRRDPPRPALAPLRWPDRPGPALDRLDEPRRPHHRHPARLCGHRPERHLPLRRHRRRGPPLLRRPVPPRGRPHRHRLRPPAELPLPHRRPRRRLVDARLPRAGHRPRPRPGRRRRRDLRPLRRRRLRRHRPPPPRGRRRPAHLRLRRHRPAALRRGQGGGRPVPRPLQHPARSTSTPARNSWASSKASPTPRPSARRSVPPSSTSSTPRPRSSRASASSPRAPSTPT